jgi:hypothetical protein
MTSGYMYLVGLRGCECEVAIYFQIGPRLKMYTLDTILSHIHGVVTLYVCYSPVITLSLNWFAIKKLRLLFIENDIPHAWQQLHRKSMHTTRNYK